MKGVKGSVLRVAWFQRPARRVTVRALSGGLKGFSVIWEGKRRATVSALGDLSRRYPSATWRRPDSAAAKKADRDAKAKRTPKTRGAPKRATIKDLEVWGPPSGWSGAVGGALGAEKRTALKAKWRTLTATQRDRVRKRFRAKMRGRR